MNTQDSRKGMKFLDFFALSFGSMVGLGWIVSSPLWVGNAGGLGSIIAVGIVTIMIIPIGFCFIELTAGLKISGAEFAFAHRCLGKGAGFATGWVLFIAYLFMLPWMCISIVSVLDYLFPGLQIMPLWTIGEYTLYLPSTLIVLAFLWWVVITNIMGMESSKLLQNILTTSLVIAIVVFLGASFTFGSPKNFYPLFNEDIGSSAGIFVALGSIAFFMTGFDTIPKTLEESHSSLTYQNVGNVMLGTILVGGGFYALVCVAIGFLAGGEISTMLGVLPAVRVFGEITGSKVFEYILLLGGFAGIITSINGFLISGVKACSFFCRANFLPASWGAVTYKNVPKRLFIAWGIFPTVFLLLGKTLLTPLIILEGVLIFIVWGFVCLSCIAFRKKMPDVERPYKVPGGIPMMFFGFLVSAVFVVLSLVPGTILSIDSTTYMLLFGSIIVVIVVYFGYSRNRDVLILERQKLMGDEQ